MKTIIAVTSLTCIILSNACGKSKKAMGPRELSLADYSRDELEKGGHIRSRVMGVWQDSVNIIRGEIMKGKLDPDRIMQLILEKENSWEWKNPYNGNPSKLVVARMPPRQGDVSISLMPPWKDAFQVQHPSTIWIRSRIKVGVIEDLEERSVEIPEYSIAPAKIKNQ